MNKLMKMATVVVGVGAMLSFAGCGEQDPKKKAANAFRELNSVVSTSGLRDGDLFPPDFFAELESGKMSEKKVKRVLEMSPKVTSGLPLYKKYIAGMKEIKGLDSEMYRDARRAFQYIDNESPMEFFDLSQADQKKCIDEIAKNIAKMKALLKGMGK